MSPRAKQETSVPQGVPLVEAFVQLVARLSSEPIEALEGQAAVLGRRLARDGALLDELILLMEAAVDTGASSGVERRSVARLLAGIVSAHGEALQEDISDARQRSRTLAASEARFRAFIDAAPDVVMVLDASSTIDFLNRSFDGRRVESVVGTRLLDALDDATSSALGVAITAALDTGASTCERISGKAPSRSAWVRAASLRRLGSAGSAKVLVFLRDIGEVGAPGVLQDTMRELEESKRQLLHAQKMEALGRLAGGVAHDFNNLLTSIVSFTRFVYDDMATQDPRREDLSEVLNAANSAAKLTNQLLSFSRRRPVDPETIDLGSELRQLSKMLRRTIGETIELVMLLPNEQIPVTIDPGQFDQVILNLAVNAHDAMPQGGTLTVTLGLLDVANGGPVAGRRAAAVTVTDSGPGIQAEVRDRIFEPFFSTKGERGTGLGLATSYGIIKQAGGDLTVTCPPTGGSEFRILLPMAGSGATQLRSLSGSYVAVRTSLRPKGLALIVDDQPAILRTMRRTLEGAGLTVQEARTAEEALALAKGVRPMILVSDVVLPGLSGIELTLRMRQMYPDLPVLLTSGYMGDEATYQIKTDETTAFQPKPFSGAQLLKKLDGLFHAEPSQRGAR